MWVSVQMTDFNTGNEIIWKSAFVEGLQRCDNSNQKYLRDMGLINTFWTS